MNHNPIKPIEYATRRVLKEVEARALSAGVLSEVERQRSSVVNSPLGVSLKEYREGLLRMASTSVAILTAVDEANTVKPKPEFTMRNWAIIDSPNGAIAYGTVCGRPEAPSGVDLRTSPILKFDIENKVVETMNSVYRLQGSMG